MGELFCYTICPVLMAGESFHHLHETGLQKFAKHEVEVGMRIVSRVHHIAHHWLLGSNSSSIVADHNSSSPSSTGPSSPSLSRPNPASRATDARSVLLLSSQQYALPFRRRRTHSARSCAKASLSG